jgi:hypothetical protein
VNDITSRLTDPTKFTGTQKVTFEGRSSVHSKPSGKRGHSTLITASTERLGNPNLNPSSSDKIASKPKKAEINKTSNTKLFASNGSLNRSVSVGFP